jgi:hypothetical protein
MALLFLVMVACFSCRKSDYYIQINEEVIRDLGYGTGTVTWTRDRTYILEGFVFVNDGQVLSIEPGTVIKARSGQGSAASALIVARGGMIMAEGSPEEPIIFTAEADDLEGSVPLLGKGLWGGVIILGRARLNISAMEAQVEGIPLSEPRGTFGGSDDEDNSGVFRYVSIRHGGTNIGEGNEINGLTLGGVGNGTTIEYVEVISNTDDGFEFFGGTVNTRYLVAAYCGDDAFDYDLGYCGKGQFWVALQEPAKGDHLIEGNGGYDPVNGLPYSLPVIMNATLIGCGQDMERNAVRFDRNAGGNLVNSILVNQTKGIEIEYIPDSDNSFGQYKSGNLRVMNNVFYDIAGNAGDQIVQVWAFQGVDVTQQEEELSLYFSAAMNIIADPGVYVSEGIYYVFPTANVFDNLAPLPDEWFEQTTFKGAFYTFNWLYGWTLIDESGMIQ